MRLFPDNANEFPTLVVGQLGIVQYPTRTFDTGHGGTELANQADNYPAYYPHVGLILLGVESSCGLPLRNGCSRWGRTPLREFRCGQGDADEQHRLCE